MITANFTSIVCGALLAAGACAGCSKSAPPPAAPIAAPAAAKPIAGARGASSEASARSSEHIASNKPDPNCKDCTGPDATSAPRYVGKPEIALDPKTLAEVQASLDANNTLLEQGIDILEKHVASPDQAKTALEKFLTDKRAEIDAAQTKAAEIRVRIKAVGYDQDIPAEIRPDFEKRMGAISERLEKVRDAYAARRDVLSTFGRLFPRPN
ncbi:MAG: hypothetical protein EXR77_18440 [Myxococcales bacterium]|nr:hypothetical protein [Myxococcales bacterium]